jgi:DNA uptake protein ComE-like DNA-binding protein
MDFKSVVPNLKSWLVLASLCLFLATGLAQTPAVKINLNSANSAQLETLPGIGPGLAKRILEHRAKHGAFKRPQDVIIIRGMSAKRFRLIAPYVTT